MAVNVEELQVRYEQLKTERSGWDTAWQGLAELFLPTRWRSDTDNSAHQSPKINGRLMNSTGVLAMRTLAAGMQGGMTSPVRPWFRIVLADRTQQADGLNAWLDEVTEAMQGVLHRSNFYNAIHGLYGDLGTFGTALLVETADEDGLHFHLVRAGEYVLDVNGKNEVDTFYRRIRMTARQIIDRWGNGENIPSAIRAAAKPGHGQGGTTRFDVIHAVFPRKDLRPGVALGPESKPFASVYFCIDAANAGKAAILDEGGYDMFPAFAPRWDVNGADVYGRSPAMDVTPDCKMLQAMSKTLRTMQHKIAAPPMLADKELKAFGVSLDPDSLNYVSFDNMSGNLPVVPIQQPEASALNYTMQGIMNVEQIIYDGLYTDLFRMLIDDDRRQITATEIQAKQQEKMILIGPVVERLHKELLEPLIMRTFQLMQDWGAMPMPPAGMEVGTLDVAFESVLAQAQKLTATSSMEQALTFFANAAAANPTVLDVLNFDEMGKAYLERIGVPDACIRDESDIATVRQQRAAQEARMAEQQDALAQTQQALDVTAAAKNLGQTPTGADGQTVLGTLLGGIGGQ